MKAIWNGQIIAESDNTIAVEGNQFFPPASVNKAFLKISETSSICRWKGTALYHTLDVDGQENKDAAWFYPKTSELAKNIEGYIAFWKGVEIQK